MCVSYFESSRCDIEPKSHKKNNVLNNGWAKTPFHIYIHLQVCFIFIEFCIIVFTV